MTDLSFSVGDNVPGLVRFWFVPVQGVASLPQRVGTTIFDDILLKQGYRWFTGEVSVDSLDYQEPWKEDEVGGFFDIKLSGFVPKDTPTSNLAFYQMKRQRYLAIYEDRNGNRKLVGDLEHTLEFTYKLSPGRSGNDSNGFEFTFSTRGDSAAFFYEGFIQENATETLTIITNALNDFTPVITKGSGEKADWLFENGYQIKDNDPASLNPDLAEAGGLTGTPQTVTIFLDDISGVTVFDFAACSITLSGIKSFLSQLDGLTTLATGLVVKLYGNEVPDAAAIALVESLDANGVFVEINAFTLAL